MHRNWRDISYLQSGNSRQRTAFRTLRDLNLPDALAPFDPMLVSTVCIGMDVEGSDLDIICEVSSLPLFEDTIRNAFGELPGFNVWRGVEQERETLSVKFRYDVFPIEIFGQNLPVEEQNAYRHLDTCRRLLQIGGMRAQGEIRALRESGLKMEAAFAHYWGLVGDPYRAILELAWLPDEALPQPRFMKKARLIVSPQL